MASSGFSVWRLEQAVSELVGAGCGGGKKEQAVGAAQKREKEHSTNGLCLAATII